MSWKNIRRRGEWLVVKIGTFVLPLLPRRAARAIGNAIGTLASIVHTEGHRVALSNLDCVFGSAIAVARKQELVRQSYQSFARSQADLYWSRRLTSTNFREIFEIENLEELKRVHGKGTFIFACLHYGGFEWIGLALRLCGFDCTLVTQPFKNPLLTPLISRLREVSGQQTIRREGAMLRLFRALRTGRSVAFSIDLTVSPRMPSVPISCFGLQTCVTFAHAWLHKRTGAPIIPTHCEPLPDGRYRLVLHPALEIDARATDQEIAQACWDRFEPLVRQNPAPWLWMYKHWRYLPPDTRRSYPYYANESPHFAKLLAQTEAPRSMPPTLTKARA
ncbi:MAG: lysophospholipid acyltransferase family protein [Chthoniobacterales bacterium]